MIITVTLNAAIDKSLVGAELPARPPPPHGRADDDAGRQGRQRRARAQDARPAGDRDRASPAAPTGTRIVEQLTEESILNDFVRIREESRTNTAVLDPTTGEQTEINERGPAVTEQEVELFRDKLLYLAQRRRHRRVRGLAAARRRRRDLRRPDPRAAQRSA